MSTYDVYGGWRPTTARDLAECAAEPYITPAGVAPSWVTQLRAAVASPAVCTCGHFPVRRHCARCRALKNSEPDTPSPVPGSAAASTVAEASTGSPIHCTTN